MWLWYDAYFIKFQSDTVSNALTLQNMTKTSVLWMANHSKWEMKLRMMMCHIAELLADAINWKGNLLTSNAPTSNVQKISDHQTRNVYHNTIIWSNAVHQANFAVIFDPFCFPFIFFVAEIYPFCVCFKRWKSDSIVEYMLCGWEILSYRWTNLSRQFMLWMSLHSGLQQSNIVRG